MTNRHPSQPSATTAVSVVPAAAGTSTAGTTSSSHAASLIHLQQLPRETIYTIMTYLDRVSQNSLGMSSKTMYNNVYQDPLIQTTLYWPSSHTMPYRRCDDDTTTKTTNIAPLAANNMNNDTSMNNPNGNQAPTQQPLSLSDRLISVIYSNDAFNTRISFFTQDGSFHFYDRLMGYLGTITIRKKDYVWWAPKFYCKPQFSPSGQYFVFSSYGQNGIYVCQLPPQTKTKSTKGVKTTTNKTDTDDVADDSSVIAYHFPLNDVLVYSGCFIDDETFLYTYYYSKNDLGLRMCRIDQVANNHDGDASNGNKTLQLTDIRDSSESVSVDDSGGLKYHQQQEMLRQLETAFLLPQYHDEVGRVASATLVRPPQYMGSQKDNKDNGNIANDIKQDVIIAYVSRCQQIPQPPPSVPMIEGPENAAPPGAAGAGANLNNDNVQQQQQQQQHPDNSNRYFVCVTNTRTFQSIMSVLPSPLENPVLRNQASFPFTDMKFSNDGKALVLSRCCFRNVDHEIIQNDENQDMNTDQVADVATLEDNNHTAPVSDPDGSSSINQHGLLFLDCSGLFDHNMMKKEDVIKPLQVSFQSETDGKQQQEEEGSNDDNGVALGSDPNHQPWSSWEYDSLSFVSSRQDDADTNNYDNTCSFASLPSSSMKFFTRVRYNHRGSPREMDGQSRFRLFEVINQDNSSRCGGDSIAKSTAGDKDIKRGDQAIAMNVRFDSRLNSLFEKNPNHCPSWNDLFVS